MTRALLVVAILVTFGLIAALPDAVKTSAVVTTIVLVAFFGWRNAVRRRRMIQGTATAKIATAAKGYAEIRGVARNPLTTPLHDPITDTPCVWFDIHTERLNVLRMRWETDGRATSSRPFAVDDGSALCLVDLAGATMRAPDAAVVRDRFTLRHHVRRIAEGQELYALGHLERMESTAADAWAQQRPAETPAASAFELDRRAALLMREWKRDPAQRKQIFDPDGDGTTDAAEMQGARELAYAAARQRLTPRDAAAIVSAPRGDSTVATTAYKVGGRAVTHWLRQSDDGRPFVVSALTEAELVAKERRSGCLWLAFFLVAASLALVAVADWLGILEA